MTGPHTDDVPGSHEETVRRLRDEVASLRGMLQAGNEPVAVVGAACRLPGGVSSPEELWRLLREGRDTVRPLTGERWNGIDFSGWDDEAFARIPRHAALIDGVDRFDAGFFGISDAEAAHMDPQQRLTLEHVWEAGERAGWTPASMKATPTGVFLGVGHQDYLTSSLAAGDEVGSRLVTGTARSLIANRVSYEFGFRGPSLTVDTACSSSLVALHLACQSLRAGECRQAFAGGVSLILSPLSMTLTGRALPMAPDGRCKAFAADADGMVRGEGIGILALKRLSDALVDGDPIEAVVLASGTNQDGSTNGLTAPSPAAQTALLDATLKASGLAPSDVTFVEMHGTGTPLGDPMEYTAVREVYGATAGDPTCWLGSVKANLGHLEFAAGVASVLKTMGALRHGTVPPQINIGQVNPRIGLDGRRFAIAREEEPWAPAERRYAAVSSFGFGGSNAHMILAHPDALPSVRAGRTPQRPVPERAVLLPLSARSAPALAAYARAVADAVREATPARLATVVGAVSRRRAHHPVRTAVAAARLEDLPEALSRAQAGLDPDARPATRQRLAFVFSGQSGQWPRMGVRLAERDATVREELGRWDEELARFEGPRILETLGGPRCGEALRDTRFAQVAIVALQTALTERLRAWGVSPVAVAGHSVGEVAAAVAAGAITRADAVAVLRARSEALHRHAAGGAMVAVRAPAQEVQAVLDAATAGNSRFAEVGIAAYNAPDVVVVAGPADLMHDIRPELAPWRPTALDTDYAFHSPGLDGPVTASVRAALETLRPAGAAHTPLYSTTTGGRLDSADLTAEHWAANAAQPVLFEPVVRQMLADGVTGFVEIGPHPALTPHLRRALRDSAQHGVAVPTLRRDQDETTALWTTVGDLWASGCPVDWKALHPGPAQHDPSLPSYPWQRTSHWIPGVPSPSQPEQAPQTAAAEAPSMPTTSSAAASESESGVLDLLVRHVASALGVGISAIRPDQPTRDLDVESVVFVELKSRLENQLGRAIPLTALTEGKSLRQIAQRIAGPEHRVTTADDARRALQNIDELSEEEVTRLLNDLETREEW
ncbi:polyketide synthase [Streptomyces viridiviolaceus]|uniref:Type I polyketide synthase n=1 Tax=Streptomyces viridiviolaceus TaxID=68282 RepID=A0ABW2E2Q5_9ACTN|nr:type I polyketide synthase [Streptomyces viridiviolaceus]GHB57122.1 polyketide synthase [Streptomyces viridiviolaceus]